MASFTNVNTLFGPDKFYAVPDYQREYAWQSEEIADFWIDIKNLFESTDNNKHFFGAVVTSKYSSDESYLLEVLASTYGIDDDDIFHLIDGQQRLTTLMIMLGCIKSCICDDDTLSDVDKGILENKYKTLMFDESRTSGGESAPKLLTKEKSGAVFTKDVLGIEPINQPDRRYKAAKNVSNATEYFTNQILELKNKYIADGKKAVDYFNRLHHVISARAQFCVIECTGDMDEFQVFESLNGKGINLTAADRIKNIYLSRAKQEYHGIATKNWDSIQDELVMIRDGKEENWIIHFFVSYFFGIDAIRTGKSKLANRFKDLIRDEGDFRTVHASLISSAKYYGKLRRAEASSEALKGTLKEIRELGQEQIYVPLLAFAHRFEVDSDDFLSIARALLVFIVRYTVCKKPTNALDGIFKSMLDLKGSGPNGEPTVAELVCFIESKQEGDDEFKSCFAKYTTKNSSTARYLLSRLELYYKIKGGDASPTLVGQTLEHIIPQKVRLDDWYAGQALDEAIVASFQEDVIQSIGNMAILSAEDNSRANNKNYLAKRKVYKDGNNKADYGKPYNTFKLIEKLCEEYPDSFNHEDVYSRAKTFSGVVCEIWSSGN